MEQIYKVTKRDEIHLKKIIEYIVETQSLQLHEAYLDF